MPKLTFEYNESKLIKSSVHLLFFYNMKYIGVTDGSFKGHVYFHYFLSHEVL